MLQFSVEMEGQVVHCTIWQMLKITCVFPAYRKSASCAENTHCVLFSVNAWKLYTIPDIPNVTLVLQTHLSLSFCCWDESADPGLSSWLPAVYVHFFHKHLAQIKSIWDWIFVDFGPISDRSFPCYYNKGGLKLSALKKYNKSTKQHNKVKVKGHTAKYDDPYSEFVLCILTHPKCTHTAVNTHTHTVNTHTGHRSSGS